MGYEHEISVIYQTPSSLFALENSYHSLLQSLILELNVPMHQWIVFLLPYTLYIIYYILYYNQKPQQYNNKTNKTNETV